MWKEKTPRKAQSYVLLTVHLTRPTEWSVQEVFKKGQDEHFQEDQLRLTGRRREVPFRTDRGNSASLSKLVGLHGSCVPEKTTIGIIR